MLNELEFCPYKGEKVPESFGYLNEYQVIVDFFNKSARKCVKLMVSKVFVMRFGGNIVGFVALSLKNIQRKDLKSDKAGGMFDRTALVIGQLIIDQKYQRHGFGKATIKWVLSVARHIGKFVPCRLIFVEAIDEKALLYYKSRGFAQLENDPMSLVLDLYSFFKK